MAVEPLSPWPIRLPMWVGASQTLTPNWAQWYSNLVLRVNDIAGGGGTFDAGNLTGTTLAANVVNSSLTGVGTLTSGATGAGFTVPCRPRRSPAHSPMRACRAMSR